MATGLNDLAEAPDRAFKPPAVSPAGSLIAAACSPFRREALIAAFVSVIAFGFFFLALGPVLDNKAREGGFENSDQQRATKQTATGDSAYWEPRRTDAVVAATGLDDSERAQATVQDIERRDSELAEAKEAEANAKAKQAEAGQNAARQRAARDAQRAGDATFACKTEVNKSVKYGEPEWNWCAFGTFYESDKKWATFIKTSGPVSKLEVMQRVQVGLFRWKANDDGKVYAHFVIQNLSDNDIRDVTLSCITSSSLTNASFEIKKKTAGAVNAHSVRQFSDFEIWDAFPKESLSCRVANFETM
jgi:hypothetical protein